MNTGPKHKGHNFNNNFIFLKALKTRNNKPISLHLKNNLNWAHI